MSSSFFSQRRTSPSVASILKVVMIAVLVISLILVFGVVVGGCAEPEHAAEDNAPDPPVQVTQTLSSALVGKWHSVKFADTMEFTADGKYTMTADAGSPDDPAAGTGTYKVDGWNLTITVSGGESATIPFTISGDTLTLEDKTPLVYIRVK